MYIKKRQDYIVMFFFIVEISLYSVPFVRFHYFSDLADAESNVWAISAPKMEGVWISPHVASGFLQNDSLEAKES